MFSSVVFDMDGVLVDSEERWDVARKAVVGAGGGTWKPAATRAMQGMSAPEWEAYLRDELGTRGTAAEIGREVVRAMADGYRADLPLLPGAQTAVRALADAGFVLAVASSANRPLIELVLELADLTHHFRAIVSSEEVARGKPAPDVYLEAARRIAKRPTDCIAIEDSSNGLRSAHAAGMTVIAVPNVAFPPARDALDLADLQVSSVAQVTPDLIATLGPA
jgi:HAD superfamily hydrolase (TIGR01509 family)